MKEAEEVRGEGGDERRERRRIFAVVSSAGFGTVMYCSIINMNEGTTCYYSTHSCLGNAGIISTFSFNVSVAKGHRIEIT